MAHHQELRHYVATAHDPTRPSRDNLTFSDKEGPESWRNRMESAGWSPNGANWQEHCRRELHRLADELDHLDATIRLFAPDYALGGIRPRKRCRAHHWFEPGECQRLVLEVLRDATGPLSDQGVTAAVAARKGLQDRPGVLGALGKMTLAVLRRLAGKGVAHADGVRGWERA